MLPLIENLESRIENVPPLSIAEPPFARNVLPPVIAPGEFSGHEFVERVRAMFAPDGRLAHAKNFEYRPEQQQMAAAVARALAVAEHLVVEAGTGVGKSLAYLIPAILWRVRKRRRRSSRHTPSISRNSSSTKTSRSCAR
jgi:hypothetical protein